MYDFTWKQFDNAVEDLYTKIIADGVKFDAIYGVPRGGVVLAVALSHRLNIPYIAGKFQITNNTLIVDDMSDTGNTLSMFLLEREDNKIATIYCNPESLLIPDYYVYMKQYDGWILFPWESYDTEKVHDL